jgi:glycerophosphoryl diester phosphodiesterase
MPISFKEANLLYNVIFICYNIFGDTMKQMNWLKETYITHRGLHGVSGWIENTRKSFTEAIDRGFGIEIDTNILKDGTVVVFHDKNLKRLCGVNRYLKDVTYDEIKDLKILDSNETIPTLSEVLDLIGGRVPLMIEVKPFGQKKRHAKAIKEALQSYPYTFAVQSYDPSIVYWFKRHAPELIRGQISEYFTDSKMSPLMRKLLRRMVFNGLTKPDFINYRLEDMPNKYIEKAKQKGILVLAYAARSQKALNYARKTFDNAVFENFIPKK